MHFSQNFNDHDLVVHLPQTYVILEILLIFYFFHAFCALFSILIKNHLPPSISGLFSRKIF